MGEIIAEIFVKWILGGIWVGLNMIYDWIKGLIFGIPKNQVERKRIEKKWLYKKVSPKAKLKIGIETGTIGTVMEIIDSKTAFVEFYDQKGEFIEIGGELAFKVELKNIKLKK
ncbi:Hypothetical protein I595_3294 [Croceitalea dokdonensis DOKDO 023]|uniref:Uncharacterized protein n=1 Tax=Croceitalea dokdonensis DOKDO 023 TaxID=1300341 RepID=A0A0P7AZ35_9FLAO|nr:hypothetical protein [Croceitalea dokdonensis]KPM30797.1 Hypothetical protein I595_3294 [Croceitalea dokdonensis DOKDO 023]